MKADGNHERWVGSAVKESGRLPACLFSLRRYLALCGCLGMAGGCLLAAGSGLNGCTVSGEGTGPRLAEQPIRRIQLAGDLARGGAEISGLAWCEDHLVILPQFPERFADHIFTVPRTRIIAYLEGADARPITPRPVAFVAPEVAGAVTGYDGYEAIGFHGRRAYLTIETETGRASQAYLATGIMDSTLSRLTIAAGSLVAIPSQVGLPNVSDEALIVAGDLIVTIHEVNGANVNRSPVVHLFDLQLVPQGTAVFPCIEYRVTDATELDGDNRFWVVNYLYTGDLQALKPGQDHWGTRFGTGVTHAARPVVERLLELQYSRQGIERTATPPILLQLAEGDTCRNWEGLARLDQRGFLLMTDEYPETILAFVARPAGAGLDSLSSAQEAAPAGRATP